MEERKNLMPVVLADPLCSICIANYNGIGIIGECIEAVLRQDADFPFEIIIHDDASTDESVQYIRSHYPDVRLITSQENVGFCVSNNRMVAAARGQYVLLLNNDAFLFPDALRTLHDYATKQTVPTILGLPQYDAETGELLDIGSLSDPFLNSIPNLNPEKTDVAMVVGACLWIPTNLWQKIGGFPEWFHTLAEDLYLCCVARLWGYSVRAVPHSGFRHWVGMSLGGGKVEQNRLSTSFRRRALSERNKIYVMILCCPMSLLAMVLPFHLVVLLLEGLLLTVLKRDIAFWRNIYAPLIPALWQTRKKLLPMRRQIQQRRSINLGNWRGVFSPWPHKLRMLLKHGLPDVH